MRQLRIIILLLLFFPALEGIAQTNFEWTNKSLIFPSGVSNQVSYIDLGNIGYWGYIEISLTGTYNGANTTGLYTKVYNIGTNISFSSNTAEVTSAIGPVASQWKLGEFKRDSLNHLVVPIHHLTTSSNSVTVYIRGITLQPINTAVFAITAPQVMANTETRDYNYINTKLGVGTSKPDADALLTVAGNINARELKVKIDAGADFVFAEDYRLPELKRVESFVKTNGHLQDIQSAKEMKNKGLLIGDFQIKLLQKVEELTLYLIEQDKKIKQLQTQNDKLELEMKEIKGKL